MKAVRYLAAILAAAALAAAAYFTLNRQESTPDVSLTLLNGSALPFKQLQGQVTVVNFWATSCATCVKEMPELIRTHEAFHARGLRTVAVAMSYDPPAYVMHYAESRKLPFDVGIDHTGAVAQAFGNVQATPTTFVIDRRGRVVKRYVGEPDFAALHQLLEQLLQAA
ncbi:MAG: TlpA family protein disulfide reductase [Aquabacterium sp.]|nr:MAG: TlpA family protein disulfide reductase [Aquabacterium sp.]